MKTQTRRVTMFLVAALVLALAVAYLSGALVSTQTSADSTGPQAPALTNAQWAAVEAANALLLGDEDDATIYLPLLLK